MGGVIEGMTDSMTSGVAIDISDNVTKFMADIRRHG